MRIFCLAHPVLHPFLLFQAPFDLFSSYFAPFFRPVRVFPRLFIGVFGGFSGVSLKPLPHFFESIFRVELGVGLE